jgi:hypothetical protein
LRRQEAAVSLPGVWATHCREETSRLMKPRTRSSATTKAPRHRLADRVLMQSSEDGALVADWERRIEVGVPSSRNDLPPAYRGSLSRNLGLDQPEVLLVDQFL